MPAKRYYCISIISRLPTPLLFRRCVRVLSNIWLERYGVQSKAKERPLNTAVERRCVFIHPVAATTSYIHVHAEESYIFMDR